MEIRQELRGKIDHWPRTGWIWDQLAKLIKSFFGFSDVCGLLSRRNNSDVWDSFRRAINFLRPMTTDSIQMARLFMGDFDPPLPIRDTLSGTRYSSPAICATGDASLLKISGINRAAGGGFQ